MQIELAKLNIPISKFRYHNSESGMMIFDKYRKKYVRLTPEEWVRQNLLANLCEEYNFPKARITTEYTIEVNEMKRRCDAVVFGKSGMPQMIIECKAPSVPIRQNVFDQIAGYNLKFSVNHLLVSNGIEHFHAEILSPDNIKINKNLPDYSKII